MPGRPIGIFDSGIGGLTVLAAARRRLPAESFIYLGDTARVPYGTKGSDTVLRYALQAAAFLVDRGVKMLVVACNTAASVALPELARNFRLPVVGVIEPGAELACRLTRSGQIGVIGTEGTITSCAYDRAILRRRPDARIFSTPCPLFVPLAEEGWGDHPVAETCAREYLSPLLEAGIDSLVLGCTHYPLLKPVLRRVVGPEVQLVDSAEATAEMMVSLLGEDGRVPETGQTGTVAFYVTDLPERFCRVGRPFLGDELDRVELADLVLPAGGSDMLFRSVPR
ncbi:MAG: glutamate racemase [Deltaproteobacteria bacterium]|nr:MAG: glutamate racemase [Deltaproteobacteria bacterium]